MWKEKYKFSWIELFYGVLSWVYKNSGRNLYQDEKKAK